LRDILTSTTERVLVGISVLLTIVSLILTLVN
jgi:hypothetical protein